MSTTKLNGKDYTMYTEDNGEIRLVPVKFQNKMTAGQFYQSLTSLKTIIITDSGSYVYLRGGAMYDISPSMKDPENWQLVPNPSK
jgi:hypothetical protein